MFKRPAAYGLSTLGPQESCVRFDHFFEAGGLSREVTARAGMRAAESSSNSASVISDQFDPPDLSWKRLFGSTIEQVDSQFVYVAGPTRLVRDAETDYRVIVERNECFGEAFLSRIILASPPPGKRAMLSLTPRDANPDFVNIFCSERRKCR